MNSSKINNKVRVVALLAALFCHSSAMFANAADCPGKAFIELTNHTKNTLYCGDKLDALGSLQAITLQHGDRNALKPDQTVRFGFIATASGQKGSLYCSKVGDETVKGALIAITMNVKANCKGGGSVDYTVDTDSNYRASYASCEGTDFEEVPNPLQGVRDIHRTVAISLFSVDN